MGSVKKACDGKVKHKTYLGAEYALNTNIQNKNAAIYKCTHCLDYHIGTKDKKNNKSKTKKKKVDEEYKRELRKVKKFRY